MESETEESEPVREFQNEEEKRAYDKKRKRKDDSRASEERETYVVGMRAATKKNGIFSDAHAIGRFISEQVGKIRIIRVTRSGTVIIECRGCL